MLRLLHGEASESTLSQSISSSSKRQRRPSHPAYRGHSDSFLCGKPVRVFQRISGIVDRCGLRHHRDVIVIPPSGGGGAGENSYSHCRKVASMRLTILILLRCSHIPSQNIMPATRQRDGRRCFPPCSQFDIQKGKRLRRTFLMANLRMVNRRMGGYQPPRSRRHFVQPQPGGLNTDSPHHPATIRTTRYGQPQPPSAAVWSMPRSARHAQPTASQPAVPQPPMPTICPIATTVGPMPGNFPSQQAGAAKK